MTHLQFLDSEVPLPLMNLPVRTVFVKIGEEGILISPGSRLSYDQYKILPAVTDIVAPNSFHCGGVSKALQFFPKARVWGVPQIEKLKPEIRWTHTLEKNNWLFQQQLPLLTMQGMPSVQETVFFEPASKTLIVGDLCFNLMSASGLGAWIILSLFGTYRKFAVSRFLLKFVKDKEAFSESLADLIKFDFESVVMTHGQPVTGNGRMLLLKAMQERGFAPKVAG